MPRYLKGSLNNAWDKGEDCSPVRTIQPQAPLSDDDLIRAFCNVRNAYRTEKLASTAERLASLGRELLNRGITTITDEQWAAAMKPRPNVTQLVSLVRAEVGVK